MKVTVHAKQKAPKIFKSEFLNRLTESHPNTIFYMYCGLSFLLIYAGTLKSNIPFSKALALPVFGLLVWTLAEYLMHRFFYHKISDGSYNSGIQYLFHGIHHAYPHDSSKTVLPVVPSLIIASLFFMLFHGIMQEAAYYFAPGFLMGYNIYMRIHTMVHQEPMPEKNNFWWKHHNIHHYQQHDRAFGVTSPLWDIIFNTMPEKNRRTVEIENPK